MKTLFDYFFDKEDLVDFLSVLAFAVNHPEDSINLNVKENLLILFQMSRDALEHSNDDAVQMVFDSLQLRVLCVCIDSYDPKTMIEEDILRIKSNCFFSLLSTLFDI